MLARRHIIRLGTGSLIVAATPALAQRDCTPGIAATERQTEGPYFTRGAPLRMDLASGNRGQRIELAGLVMTRRCQPVAGAIVDLWHADATGRYDNAGYGWRGHQVTDARGAWRFDTIAPGAYPGRTRHYHVKVTPPGGRTLTTQLYFPGDPGNARDGIYRPSLQMRMSGTTASYDFVVEV